MLYYRKKESNKKHYLKIIILIGIIILSQVLPVANRVSSNIALTILKPVNQFTSFVTTETQLLIDNLFGSKPNRDKVEELTYENNELQNENNRLRMIINEDDILKSKASLEQNRDLIKASVIAIDNNKTFNNFIIDKGETSNVSVGDIIVGAYATSDKESPGALVGKVEEVYLNTSKVGSIMDDKFNLTFMHANTNGFGVINTRFSGLLEGYMLDKSVLIEKGDTVLTSGIGGVYNKGILIGTVEEVSESTDELTKLVKIKSPIDFNRIYDVFIMKNQGEANE
ncbi:MAG: rod shape-determining protein MreC [Tissierellia bacterium]|nr:rod shape-determining protein MreC [Tissierellia bacterium]